MSDQSWEEQFKKFWQKTGEDFRRASEDIKAEAQRLMDGAMDADKQQKIRNRLNELGAWARKAAQDVAGAVEEAASKAGTAFQDAAEKVTQKVSEMKGPAESANAPSGASGTPAAGKSRPKSRSKSKRGKTGKSGKRKR
ncbi:MAG TPA: hypothetical protein VG496_14820 [Myxococcales bacterium]|nr:hypothetical protein [Myxococcales bacterium]